MLLKFALQARIPIQISFADTGLFITVLVQEDSRNRPVI